MALICTVSKANLRGNEIASAVEAIRTALGTLRKFDGMRIETIGVSPEYFGEIFGVTSNPQAMSDRWGAIAAGNYTGLADFVNATVSE